MDQDIGCVMLAGMAVSAAEPSGLWGTLKEVFASGSAVAAAKADASSNELIKAGIANLGTSEGSSAVQEALRKQFTGAAGRCRSALPCQFARGLGDPECQSAWRRGSFQGLAANHQPKGRRSIL